MSHDDAQVVEQRSICFCCENAKVMLIEVTKSSPEMSPLSKQIQIKQHAHEVHQAECHARGGAIAIGLNCAVLACTDFVQGAEKTLLVPSHMETPKSLM